MLPMSNAAGLAVILVFFMAILYVTSMVFIFIKKIIIKYFRIILAIFLFSPIFSAIVSLNTAFESNIYLILSLYFSFSISIIILYDYKKNCLNVNQKKSIERYSEKFHSNYLSIILLIMSLIFYPLIWGLTTYFITGTIFVKTNTFAFTVAYFSLIGLLFFIARIIRNHFFKE